MVSDLQRENEDGDIELGSSPSFHAEDCLPRTQNEPLLTSNLRGINLRRHGIRKSVSRILHIIDRWTKGPHPSRSLKIKPFLPQLQSTLATYLHQCLPKRKHRLLLLLATSWVWAIAFSGILSSSLSNCQISGYDTPIRLSCVSRFW